jgi:hypothetical protein
MKRACSTVFLIASLVGMARPAAALTLTGVPYYSQEQTEWCWDASSEMVLGYFGITESQTEIAAYGSAGQNVPNYLTGTHAATPTSPALNGVDLVLMHFGNIGTTFYDNALSVAQLQAEINSSNLAILALGWCSNPKGPFVWNAGGHAIVVYGFDGTTVDINDPAPENGQFMQLYTTLLGGAAGTYRPTSARFMWEQTLVTASAVDVVIQIDSTGSMGDEIAAVVPEAITIVNNIFSTFRDARVAVVDYKDNPDYAGDYGATSDYIAFTDQTYTTNISDVVNAIEAIQYKVYGGGDIPEAVYSALYNTLEGGASVAGESQTSVLGSYIGGWRPDPVKRIIIDFGDAGGHDPVEPWANGHSIADVVALASSPGFLITIDTIPCAVDFGSYYDPRCLADFAALSAGTGGLSLPAGSAEELTTNITTILEQTSQPESRLPSGSIAAIEPLFTFTFDGGGMFNPPSYYEIQILRSNANKGTFSTYLTARTPTNYYVPKSPLPTNTYRWRAGFAQPASKILAANGAKLTNVPASVVYDAQYTEFQREPVLPAAAIAITPSTSTTTTNYSVASAYSFTATNATMTYSWTNGINATSYSVAIYAYNTKKETYKLWKRLTVAPPAKNPHETILSVKVGGHTKNDLYEWTIESLNYDHPKPTSTLE